MRPFAPERDAKESEESPQTIARAVQLIRRGMAWGTLPDAAAVEQAWGVWGELGLRRAIYDMASKRFSRAEEEVIRFCYGVVTLTLLGAVLGRTVEAVRRKAARMDVATDGGHGRRPARRCRCGAVQRSVGYPVCEVGEGVGTLRWAEKCLACDREVLYSLSWGERNAQENRGKTPDASPSPKA